MEQRKMTMPMPIRSISLMVLAWMITGPNGGILGAKDEEAPTKSIRGHVTDKDHKSVAGATVFIRNTYRNTTTVLVTDTDGVYSIFGLDPQYDYEVHAEKGNLSSTTKTVSSFLERPDTVLDFELKTAIAPKELVKPAETWQQRVEMTTSDGVVIAGTWFQPSANPEGRLPLVLVLHDIGETRSVWNSFVTQHLLKNNLAALSIDFRGHGESSSKGSPTRSGESQPPVNTRPLLLDVAAALEWMKSRPSIDDSRIAVMGEGLGASVAFVASGQFEAVRSVVALSAGLDEAQTMSQGIVNFQPHSILFLATQTDSPDALSAHGLEKLAGFPVRVQIYEDSKAKGQKIFEEVPQASDLVLEWLKNTL
jgi:dienelactone hydrolase